MKTTVALLALLLLPACIPFAAGSDAVTVTLQVNAGISSAPAWRDCGVTVPAGSNVGDVLDQAVADGCILAWSAAEFPGFGRYVTSIDHVTEAVATYWAFRFNGEYSQTGIDATFVFGGETILFTYEQWIAQL